METVSVYVDGAASPNPGRGGYAALIFRKNARVPSQVVTGGYRLTTNNRMELMAVISALEAIEERSFVVIVCDSQYVVKGRDWCKAWRRRGWRKSNGKAVLNMDLWERLSECCQRHQVEFRWIRGHSGDVLNEQCDQLASEAAARAEAVDAGYERVAPVTA